MGFEFGGGSVLSMGIHGIGEESADFTAKQIENASMCVTECGNIHVIKWALPLSIGLSTLSIYLSFPVVDTYVQRHIPQS